MLYLFYALVYLGSEYLIMYYRLFGASIGSNVCMYPAGYHYSLPEPDLISIGSNTTIDDAYITCSSNWKGIYKNS